MPPAAEACARKIDCVFLTSSAKEFQVLRKLLAPAALSLYHAATLEQARFTLGITHARVLLTEIDFADGDWEDALDMLMRFYPRTELVVASPRADEDLWLDVLDRGAYDLLLKPFRREEVLRILDSAASHGGPNEGGHGIGQG